MARSGPPGASAPWMEVGFVTSHVEAPTHPNTCYWDFLGLPHDMWSPPSPAPSGGHALLCTHPESPH